MTDDLLFARLAAAYVRGKLAHMIDPPLSDPALSDPPLAALSDEQQAALLALGRAHGLRMHRFKRTMGLPRVAKVLGILRGLAPTELLDIGMYIKVEQAGAVVARYKYVRPDFLQTVLDSGSHWQERLLLPNQLAPGVQLW